MNNEAIRLDDVMFTYLGAQRTIHDVSLQVKKGECVVLMGPSGSGKTTITRLINGLAGGYYDGTIKGRVRIEGRDARHLRPWQRAERVGSVFQDPASRFFSNELAGEVAFGCENLGYCHEEVVAKTDEAIERLNIDGLRNCRIDLLSSGQKQNTAIASAIAPRPSVIVMDEPSANLDMVGTRTLGETIKRLKEQGFTIIVAEHRISYLMESADRFHYISGGRIAGTYTGDQLISLPESVRRQMGIRSPVYVSRLVLESAQADRHRENVAGNSLILEDVSLFIRNKPIFSNISLTVSGGQILALTGANGAGKTCLARVIAGSMRKSAGKILINGRRHMRPQKHVWYSSNDVSAEFFTASVADEVLLSLERTEEHLERARSILKKLGLYELKEKHPVSLSGGQKQRLSVACGLLSDRAVLILDEPTSGLDYVNMYKLAEALQKAAAEGRAVIVITHDNEFMKACCTHAYHLC